MLYKFDQNTLNYKKVTGTWLIGALCILLVSVAITSMVTMKHLNDVRFINEETRAVIIREADKNNTFSEQRLKEYILELNVKYPHIVIAQAQLESGMGTSPMFKSNKNLFGLKCATRRPTTNKGEENGHAFYNDWHESVQDYAFLQAAYMHDIKSEDEYYQYLGEYYAEDPSYIVRLKDIVSKRKLKEWVKENKTSK